MENRDTVFFSEIRRRISQLRNELDSLENLINSHINIINTEDITPTYNIDGDKEETIIDIDLDEAAPVQIEALEEHPRTEDRLKEETSPNNPTEDTWMSDIPDGDMQKDGVGGITADEVVEKAWDGSGTVADIEFESEIEDELADKIEDEATTVTEIDAEENGTRVTTEKEDETEDRVEAETDVADEEAGTKNKDVANLTSDVQTDADTDAGIDVQADAETETEADAEAGIDVQTDTGTDAKTDIQAVDDIDAGIDVQADADTKTETEAEAETDTKTFAGTDAETDARTNAGTAKDPVQHEEVSSSHKTLLENDIPEDKELKTKTAVIDELTEKQPWRTDMPGSPVRDIRSAISLNDRILFINTLFGGSPMKFQEAVGAINAMESLDQVVEYVKANYDNWDLSSETAYRFMMAARRRVRK